jgi:hypothetical protein
MKQIPRWLLLSLAVAAPLALLSVAACSSDSTPVAPSSLSAPVGQADLTAQGGNQAGTASQGGNLGGNGSQGDCPSGNQGECQSGTQDGTQGTIPLATLEVALSETLQDEYHAASVYQSVLNEFGEDVVPFANIIGAEQQHATSIAALFTNRSLPVPASQWTASEDSEYASVAEACAAGVLAEKANIALYDRWLQYSLPTDVQRVFQNNRRASLENHLPAFERCR